MANPASKRCSKCGEMKPLTEFYRDRAQSGGLKSRCKGCSSADSSRYRGQNHDALLKRRREVYKANPEADNERCRRYYDETKQDRAEQSRHYRAQVAAKVHARYGPNGVAACWCCGTTERLEIDHVHGGGTAHRVELFGRSAVSTGFYLWLIREGFPPGYQTLCRVCNVSKGDGERCQLWHAADTLRWIADPEYRKG